MNKSVLAAHRARIVLLCLATALVTVGLTASFTLARTGSDSAVAARRHAKTLSSSQIRKLVKKYAKSYGKHYATPGPAGPAGAAGANGVVTGYTTNSVPTALSMFTSTLATLNLPAGSYLLHAKVQVQMSDSTPGEHGALQCWLDGPNSTEIDKSTYGVVFGSGSYNTALPLEGTVTIPAGGDKVVLYCGAFGTNSAGVSASTQGGRLQAIPTASNVTQ